MQPVVALSNINILFLLFETSARGIHCTAGKRGSHGLHCGGGGEHLWALQQPDKNSDGEGPREIYWTIKSESTAFINFVTLSFNPYFFRLSWFLPTVNVNNTTANIRWAATLSEIQQESHWCICSQCSHVVLIKKRLLIGLFPSSHYVYCTSHFAYNSKAK